MPNLNNKNPNNNNTTNTNTYSKTLIALKPRPVLLAQRNRTTTMTVSTLNEENCSKITSLTPELKSTLHEIILFYLHRNGFSKTLKRFQSEVQIQSDAWKASSLHLEDIFCKYNACNTKSNKNTSKKPVLGNDEAIEKNEVCPTNEETTTKKKKKRGIDESDNGAIKDQSEVIDKKIVDELETKSKKKKKMKNDLNFSGQAEEAKTDVLNKPVDDTINGLKIDDSTRTTKDKKKKSVEEEKLEPSTTNENEVAQKERKKKKKKSSADSDVKDEVNKVKTDAENESIFRKEKMSSKKRKRSLSDEKEHENVSTEMTVAEESKRQKTEISKEEKSEKEEISAQETCNQQLNGQTTGKIEINGGEKSGVQKSTKKQRNATAEPKTVNAFQRVKMDQVEFAHEKLQDNSYWAKDGADIGYGAKAQEVLGQVRGRDFRHEKTKKKRGSYRGGLIDLQSHSIKFDYSDED